MHNDLTFFTNDEHNSLLARFKSTLKDVQYFDVLVGYFRTSGFYELYESFENIDKIRILVGLNADKKTVEIIQSAKQQKIDYESPLKTKEVFSENLAQEVYEAKDKYDVEVGIKKFIEFLKSGKLEIKAYPSNNIHAKVYISKFKEDDRDYGRVITGSSNFSEPGLKSQYEFNVELKNYADVKYAEDKFEDLWTQAVDLSETYIDTINKKTWLNDEIQPYELYIKFLYEYLKEKLEENDDVDIQYPKDFMELKYQKQAVITLKDIVEQYNGAFIADVVGLGKTYIAAMYAQNLPGKKLVICPPPIKDAWEDAFRDFGVRNFEVESLGRLHHIIKKGTENYHYVFIDEAHRFRNENTNQYELLNQICYGKKVLLISATPLNNSVYDFFALLKLFQSPKNSDIPGMPNLESFFVNARNKLKQYDKSDPEYLNEVKRISKKVRDKILKYVMVRRTRTDVIKYFKKDIVQQGLFFPEVSEPNRIIYKFDEKTNINFNRTIALIKSIKYARYQPGTYIADAQKKLDAFGEQQQKNMAGFMKSRLVKRLESSKFAFEQTIERFIKSYKKFIDMYEKGTVYISQKIDVYEFIDNDNEEALLEELDKDKKAKVYKKEEFTENFYPDLKADYQMLLEIQKYWKQIDKDFKKEKFVEEIKNDVVLKNNKIIIFTESTETGKDLYEILEKELGAEVLFFSSNFSKYKNESISSAVAKDIIKENYDPKNNNNKNDIRVLITTDVLAEGINLHLSNVIVNYDLPWNPTRILQRVGRVNRVGTKHKKVHIYNIFPTSETDEHLGLEDSIKAKIQAFHETLGEDAQYLSEDETFTNHKLFGEELYRKLNSKCTYEECEDEEENVELKYLDILKNIRDNNKELFDKVKKLPKKARSARSYKTDKNKLISFFKKGKLKKFYITDSISYPVELPFDEAVKYFECEKDCTRKTIKPDYYSFLEKNKEAFVTPDDVEVIQIKNRGGASNEKYVKQRIEFALQEGRLTDTQEVFLNKVLKLFDDGIIVKETSKKLKELIEKEKDSLKLYNLVKENVPEIYLNIDKNKKKKQDEVSEIILSEFLEAGE